MIIGLLVADFGDGYQGIRFFKETLNAQIALEEDEEYYSNECVTFVEVPDDFVPPGFWAD